MRNEKIIDELVSNAILPREYVAPYKAGAKDMARHKDELFEKAIKLAKLIFLSPLRGIREESADNVIDIITLAYYDVVEETNYE